VVIVVARVESGAESHFGGWVADVDLSMRVQTPALIVEFYLSTFLL
jgi:hypothetical protein